MKYIKLYLKKHILGVVLFVFATVIYAIWFANFNIEMRAVIYPSVLIFVVAVFLFVYGVLKDKKRHEVMDDIFLKRGDVGPDNYPEALSVVEEDYLKLVLLLKEEIAYRENNFEDKNRNLSDYYTMWVHRIKTPIASMKLKLSETDSESARLISSDLRRIEQYVDMVLTYVRLSSDSTDYVFRKVNVDNIIKPALRKFSHDFISKKLSLSYESSDVIVLTDEKWLRELDENGNTKEGGITISVAEEENAVNISVKDTGIGIPAENLPRIFESGYTGFNGRTDSHSSGIGLYICKKICDNLGIKIDVSSEVSKGSEFVLKISKEERNYE